jgi:hypothetical protein
MVLENLLGTRLIVWAGSTVPTPPSRSVLAALSHVQVTNDAEAGDGFQLTFTLGKDKAIDYDLISSGVVEPMTRVLIGVVTGVVPEVLIDGVVTNHQLSPSNEPGMSTLTVTGSNLTVMLDLDERNEPYRNQPDSAIVTQLLLGYPQLGLIPNVTTTFDVPIELYRVPRQHETDLAFIRRMAERNGYVFYIEPVTFGVNNAHWGPETRFGVPKPALTMNMGSATNTKDLSFSNDALSAVGVSGTFIEPFSGMVIPIPPLPSLRIPPLSASPSTPNRTVLLRDTASQDVGQAALSFVSTVTNAEEPIRGTGTVDTVRYGSILRARGLVGVRGAGYSYDGNYYVRRVTHDIARGSYSQSFTLSREGTGALFPVVLT